MNDNFDTLINSYLENNVGVVSSFISDDLAQNLRLRLLELKENNLLQTAGIGNAAKLQRNTEIRNDAIFWLDRSHDNYYENAFLDQIDAFVKYLNRNCYTGIKSYEFHFALFEKGSFYRKHFDQFQNNSSRQFSMITYLNPNWKSADGGELCIYNATDKQIITPENKKTVFFKSNELLHEVLETNQPRLSITGWLKRD
jgi:SM-20-related protein